MKNKFFERTCKINGLNSKEITKRLQDCFLNGLVSAKIWNEYSLENFFTFETMKKYYPLKVRRAKKRAKNA
jgi:hypothetical protein